MTIQELKDNIIKYHISKPILGYYMSNPEALQRLSLEDLITKGYVTQSYYIGEIRKEIAKGAEPEIEAPAVEIVEDETPIVEIVEEIVETEETKAETEEAKVEETKTETIEIEEKVESSAEDEAAKAETEEQTTSKPKAKKSTKSSKK